MGRRTRMRYVKNPPNNFYFKSVEADPISESYVTLTLAEFEAMRLKHYIPLTIEGFKQTEAADKMGVSQPTFSRILESAHQKVTKALIEGKQIRVYGGNIEYKPHFKGYGCLNCDEEWEDSSASIDREVKCPNCSSNKTYFLEKEPL